MLEGSKESLTILIIGGANMCLVQKSRDITHDIDTYTEQENMLQKYRSMVSKARGVDMDWINPSADLVITPKILKDSHVWHKFSNLTVYTPSDAGMLALKVTAARPDSYDLSDAAFLIKKLGIKTTDEIKTIVDYYTPKWWDNFGYTEKFCKEAIEKAYK